MGVEQSQANMKVTLSSASILALLIISQVSASPLPQDGDDGYSLSSIVGMIKQLSRVVKTSGDVITSIAKDKTDNQDILDAGKLLSKADELPGDLVEDKFQVLVSAVPAIKGNITKILDKLPEIQDLIEEKVGSIPPKSELRDSLKTVFSYLPSNEYVASLEDHIDDQIDFIPSQDVILKTIKSTVEKIPNDDFFHSQVDELVDTISPVVEELNDTGAAA